MSEHALHGVGRRKTAVARVSIRPGKGVWSVNGKPLETFFPRASYQMRVEQPLVAGQLSGQLDITVRVSGGGTTGQADAVRMGLARALVAHDEELRGVMRAGGFLTRDSRKVERKKPGRPKARKRFQFSKR